MPVDSFYLWWCVILFHAGQKKLFYWCWRCMTLGQLTLRQLHSVHYTRKLSKAGVRTAFLHFVSVFIRKFSAELFKEESMLQKKWGDCHLDSRFHSFYWYFFSLMRNETDSLQLTDVSNSWSHYPVSFQELTLKGLDYVEKESTAEKELWKHQKILQPPKIVLGTAGVLYNVQFSPDRIIWLTGLKPPTH